MRCEVCPCAVKVSQWWRAVGCVALMLAALVAAGCGKRASSKTPKGSALTSVAPSADEALESANEALYKKTDHATCHAAIQQLNTYLSRHEADKPKPLSPEEQARLETDFAIDAEELAELNSSTFTLLDAYHLETCFLLRDIARSLEVDGRPPLEQANAAFAWVMRQVRLDERQQPSVPELFVLRRGRGQGLERARVFLALLEQLGIEGCLLRIPLEKDPALIVRVLPGVLVDKEIYLFDSRLGLPVPGPGGKGTVTLTQLRQDPVLLSQFTVDGQHPYDITPEQVKQAEVLWYCSLSALAPRMKLLETLLPEKNKVRLATDHVARLERVRAATLASGTPVRTCDAAGRALPLARLLRYFLPASDGGVDPVQSYPVHMLDGFAPPPKEGEPIPVLPSTQLNLFHLELAPWKYFPESLRGLRWHTGEGLKVRSQFAGGFARIFLDDRSPRDLLMRGHLEEAMRALTSERDALDQYRRAASAEPTAEADMAAWCTAVNAVYDAIALGQIDAPVAREKLEELERVASKRLPLVLIKGLSQPLEIEIAYALALCKHEQAERAELGLKRPGSTPGTAEIQAARDAWKAAASWWVSFEQAHDAAPAVVHARNLHARACEALDLRDTAIAILENFSGPVSEPERVARLYRVRQLKR